MTRFGGTFGLMCSAAAAGLLFFPATSRANSAAPVAADAADAADAAEIVVTAQQREQRLVDVPVPVTQLSGEILDTFKVQGMGDLSLYTPGFLVQEQSVQRSGFNLRGLTQDDSSPVSEPVMSIFTDGVDNSRQAGAVSELIDVDNIQVIRGPQGTLFGRGSVIGVLAIETKRPANDFEAQVNAEVGSYDLFNISGVVNAPIVDDKLAVRGAVRFKKRDGTVRNLALPGTRLNGVDTFYGRGSVRFSPTEAIMSDLIFTYQEDHPPATQFKSIVVAPEGGDTSPFTASAQDRPDQGIDRKVWGLTWDNRIELADTVDLRSITGFRKVDAEERWDGDGTAYSYIIGDQHTKQKQISEELRVTWAPDPSFTLMGGGSWFHEKVEDVIGLGLNEQYMLGSFPTIAAPDRPIVAAATFYGMPVTAMNYNAQTRKNDRTSLAAYVNVSKTFFDRLTIDAGLRYTHDEATTEAAATRVSRDGIAPIALPNGLFGNSNGVFASYENPFSFWTPRGAVSFKVTPDLNVYVGIARGMRSGVVDAVFSRTAVGPATFNLVEPEEVVNYEAGVKWKFGAMNADLTFFKYDYTNLQVRDPNSLVGALINAGSAEGKGFEASLRGEVLKGLNLIASYAYTDAGYTSFFDSAGKDLSGNRFRLSPRNKASLGLSYEGAVTDTLNITARVTEFYQSKVYFNADNLPHESQDGYAVTNIGVGLKSADGGWGVEAYVNNLFDKDYLLDLGNTGKGFGLPTAIRGEPRIAGIRFSQNF
ncbi:Outer membrane receptor proteins, mostly Fe transport [Sphingomonas laterariae]|uniref:Outer membrane receptor proteins, mostly Fe transport n=1 Tax=Edaphosphingomonas laterariae TaxID=861865 RepID=A0A239CDB9_9SPHN|nr:TonB-dependent receptor [Sphingomonas laterariae]SNS17353.1 Outer membrane receptor proteins, mostly Fe transport [Sphingomonas laterariae]